MDTKPREIEDVSGTPIPGTVALTWGNNAAWQCVRCGKLLGGRTGKSEYVVSCRDYNCKCVYEILQEKNRNGRYHLGRAIGVRMTSYLGDPLRLLLTKPPAENLEDLRTKKQANDILKAVSMILKIRRLKPIRHERVMAYLVNTLHLLEKYPDDIA